MMLVSFGGGSEIIIPVFQPPLSPPLQEGDVSNERSGVFRRNSPIVPVISTTGEISPMDAPSPDRIPAPGIQTAQFFCSTQFFSTSLIFNKKVRNFTSHCFPLLPKNCALLRR